MALLIAAGISLIALLVTAQNWRAGFIFVLIAGLLQGPLRKLTPGVPAYYILWPAVLFLVVLFFAWQRRQLAPIRLLYLEDPGLRELWSLFGLLFFLQMVHAGVRWSPLVPMLGAIEYLMPLAAVLLGAGLARNPRRIFWYLRWYVLLMVPAALSVYLSVWYQDAWPILRDVGTFIGKALIIYDMGTVMQSFPGTFRVGEIASWHAATGAVFLFILAFYRKRPAFWLLVVLLMLLLTGAILYTGRRKMLLGLTLFLGLQTIGLGLFYKGVGKWLILALPLVGVASLFPGFLTEVPKQEYVGRGLSVFTSADDRLETGLNLMRSAIIRADGIGLGVGVYSQGARYAGVDLSSAVGGAGEAGMGKLVLELGIPGVLLILFLGMRFVIVLLKLLRFLKRQRDPSLPLLIFLGSYLLTQGAIFSVATQLFGDPFVLINLGLMMGFFAALLWRASIWMKSIRKNREIVNTSLPIRKELLS